jgi:[ribosomal protein S18]-alanine N-acetyltransferase
MHTANDLTIRWRIDRDNLDLIRIDERCYLDPLTHNDLIAMLRDRNVISVVAEDRGHVLGYVIYRLSRWRIEILRMGVDPIERRCGVGTAMLQRLKDKLSHQRRDTLRVDVPGMSLAAQLCLQRCGFVGESRPGDVIRFEFHLEADND